MIKLKFKLSRQTFYVDFFITIVNAIHKRQTTQEHKYCTALSFITSSE